MQLGTQFPQGLDQLFLAPYTGAAALDQYGMAKQNNQMNQQSSMQDYLFKQQSQPLKLQQDQATLDQTLLGNEKSRLDNTMYRDTFDEQKNAKLRDLAAKMSDDDVKMIKNNITKLLSSRDPNEQAEGQALLAMSEDMLKMREQSKLQHGNKMAEIGETGRQARLTQQQAIDAGKYKPKGGGGAKAEADMIGKMSFDKQAGYYRAKAREANLAGDQAAFQYYMNEANLALMEFQRSKMLGAQAGQGGKIDVPGVAELPSVPMPQPQGFPQQGQGTPQQATGTVGPATKNINAIPAGAREMLKKNPKLAPQFDQKYGPGAAQQVLGNGS